jgi:hypothetical protein
MVQNSPRLGLDVAVQLDGGAMVASWKRASTLVAVGFLIATMLVACSEALPLANFPNITKLPEQVLNKDQQQKTMNNMIEKGQSQQAEAIKQIEQGK